MDETRRRSVDKLGQDLGVAMQSIGEIKSKALELAHRHEPEEKTAGLLDSKYSGECLVWKDAVIAAADALLPALWAMKLPRGTIEKVDKRGEGRALKEVVHITVYPLIPLELNVAKSSHRKENGEDVNAGEAKFLCISKGGAIAEREFRVTWDDNRTVLKLQGEGAAAIGEYRVENPAELFGAAGNWWTDLPVETYNPEQYAQMIRQLNELVNWHIEKSHKKAE